eukprot:623325-Rhodomonas_salina.3
MCIRDSSWTAPPRPTHPLSNPSPRLLHPLPLPLSLQLPIPALHLPPRPPSTPPSLFFPQDTWPQYGLQPATSSRYSLSKTGCRGGAGEE